MEILDVIIGVGHSMDRSAKSATKMDRCGAAGTVHKLISFTRLVRAVGNFENMYIYNMGLRRRGGRDGRVSVRVRYEPPLPISQISWSSMGSWLVKSFALQGSCCYI